MSDPDLSTVPALDDGPCQPWIDGDTLAAACGATSGSTDLEIYESAAEAAGRILFQMSGRIYTGICTDTVRPRFGPHHRTHCGCGGLSRVKLAGVVRDIIWVKVDGDTIDADLYRVDGNKWLVRLAGADGSRAYWPTCQRHDLADTEDDTFSVRYFHGLDVPAEAVAAANQLGCELFKAGQGRECRLPAGTVAVSKKGLSIDVAAISVFLQKGQTGLPLVDVFLKSANPTGRRRRPAFFSADNQPYARRAG